MKAHTPSPLRDQETADGGSRLTDLERSVVPDEGIVINVMLTERERNVLRFVSVGMSNRDLANRLSVSENTIKWHLRNILEKFQTKNRVQAIALARRAGVID
jgi:DNA-binding CsgD family transcriptional regulator